MFRWIARKTNKIANQLQRSHEESTRLTGHEPETEMSGPGLHRKVSVHVRSNWDYIRERFGQNDGIVFRTFQAGKSGKRPALLVGVTGMVEKTMINENIIGPMMSMELSDCGDDIIQYLKDSVLPIFEILTEDNLYKISQLILSGNAALFIEGGSQAIILGAAAWEMRGIEQPVSETVIRGPRDSFVEDLEVNMSLLRRRIRHSNVRFETMTIGTVTRTKVVYAYIEGIVNMEIVEEVKRRLDHIQTDGILESGYIEQYIEDETFSLFPTVANSEKPDIVTARLLEGRVAILVDGSPIALVVPDLLIGHFHVSEDYYSRPFYASLIRLLRYLSFFTTIMFPALFIAIQYHHPILIPYSLLLTLAKSREGVPFQLYIEVVVMILVFEVIREAGLRMPRPIGQAVSIVGALILGEAAVEAGLVGIPVVVVVAFAGMSTFLINSLAESISILRLLFAIAGASFGIYGILLLGMVVVIHLASLRSFGIPYASPLFPIVWSDWKDWVYRLPLRMLWHRPKALHPQNYVNLRPKGVLHTHDEGKRQE